MNTRQKVILGITVLVSASMAYFLQDMIRLILFEPVSYLWYMLHLLYLSVAQIVFWFVLVVIVALIAFGSLYGSIGPVRSAEADRLPQHGPIERLARNITRSADGIYYKWLVANRLGKLARSALMQRSGREDLAEGLPAAPEWTPPADVRSYLESGLKKTFADFPRRKWFSSHLETPFDIDVEEVIAYLESKLEERRD